MSGQIKIKKLIAKEIIIFFGTVCIWLLICGGVLFRNEFYINKSNTLIDELEISQTKLNNLPLDRIKSLYEAVSSNLFLKFEVNSKTNGKIADSTFFFDVQKINEEKFLAEFPSAKLLSPSSIGFSKVTMIYQSEQIDIFKDSLVFDFVNLEQFKKHFNNISYLNKFYEIFSKDYNLGSQLEFEEKIKDGLSYSESVEIKRGEFTRKIPIIKESLEVSSKSIWSRDRKYNVMCYIAISLLILVYPIRFSYLSLKWAFKTVNSSN